MDSALIQTLTAFGTIAAALAAAIAALYSAMQVKAIFNQLKQTQEQLKILRSQVEHSKTIDLTQLSNQQNWNQLDRFDRLPPMLPDWIGISERGMAWRVVFLNHLNLLNVVFIDSQNEFGSNYELKSWILKARYWFVNFWEESNNSEVNEGRKILKQLLRPEEGYTKEFREWLINSHIISSSLISDL